MKVSRIALFAGLGMLLVVLPTVAAPLFYTETDVRGTRSAHAQLAQYNATRAINEARGGAFKKPKKVTTSKKKGNKKHPLGPSKA
jgi:hypothetical protein